MTGRVEGLRIDIVSDVVCPWCAIGYYQLTTALERAETRAEIHLHPFELHPDMDHGGENYVEYLVRKYGMTRQQVAAARDRLSCLGREVGFTFNYSDEMRTYNSFAAHRLIHWAGTFGQAVQANTALFHAFFTDRRAIDQTEVLLDIAEEIGLDRREAESALESSEIANAVRAHERFWTSRGVRGVPAMIFDQEHVASGAQGVANYLGILQRAGRTEAV